MLNVLEANLIPILIALLIGFVVAFLIFRMNRAGATRVERRAEGESPYVASQERPYMKPRTDAAIDAPAVDPTPPVSAASSDGPQGNSIADEIATAGTDVAGDFLGVAARPELPGAVPNPDNLELLKGVGPRFAARLNELGISRFEQLAALNANQLSALDEKLGPFRGRIARDRVVEQAGYLARGDRDGFEERFGKLGKGAA